MQLFDAVGWQPTEVKEKDEVISCCRLARMQLFDAVGWQPAAVKGVGCSYLQPAEVKGLG